jgi:hypothetical protein
MIDLLLLKRVTKKCTAPEWSNVYPIVCQGSGSLGHFPSKCKISLVRVQARGAEGLGAQVSDFISEDDLNTFEGWLKYQAIDLATLTPDELKQWREVFEEGQKNKDPKMGLMQLKALSLHPSHQPKAGEDLHELLSAISHRLDHESAEQKAIFDRLGAIENQTKVVPLMDPFRTSEV